MTHLSHCFSKRKLLTDKGDAVTAWLGGKDLGGGGWGPGGSIEPPKLKQLTSKTYKNIKETQSFLKVHNQATTIFKK